MEKLHRAVHAGDGEEVERLVFQERVEHDCRMEGGLTPLMLAVLTRHWRITELLLHGGASTNLQNDSGDTALHLAVRIPSMDMAQLLVLMGKCDVNIRNREGQTPLDCLSLTKFDKYIGLFLKEHGASDRSDGFVLSWP